MSDEYEQLDAKIRQAKTEGGFLTDDEMEPLKPVFPEAALPNPLFTMKSFVRAAMTGWRQTAREPSLDERLSFGKFHHRVAMSIWRADDQAARTPPWFQRIPVRSLEACHQL